MTSSNTKLGQCNTRDKFMAAGSRSLSTLLHVSISMLSDQCFASPKRRWFLRCEPECAVRLEFRLRLDHGVLQCDIKTQSGMAGFLTAGYSNPTGQIVFDAYQLVRVLRRKDASQHDLPDPDPKGRDVGNCTQLALHVA
jgi:hypothetical protein